MRGLRSIAFDTTGLTLQADQQNARVWLTALGDTVTLNALSKPLDFQAIPAELDSIRARSRAQIARYRGAIVEGHAPAVALGVDQEIDDPRSPADLAALGQQVVAQPFHGTGQQVAAHVGFAFDEDAPEFHGAVGVRVVAQNPLAVATHAPCAPWFVL